MSDEATRASKSVFALGRPGLGKAVLAKRMVIRRYGRDGMLVGLSAPIEVPTVTREKL